MGAIYLYLDEYDRAVDVLERSLKLDPMNSFGLANLGLAHVQKGNFQKGIEEIENAAKAESPHLNPMSQCESAYAYSKAGYDNKPREILSLLLNDTEQNPGWATAIAGVYSVLGEREKAFTWLEKAYEAHSGFVIFIGPEFAFDNIRSDPQFDKILVKIGLRRSAQTNLVQQRSDVLRSQSEGEKSSSAKSNASRIAVLPFANISPDPKDEYFADGMTEELISTLSKIRGLKVISRTSVLRYKQTSKSLSEIAKELNVEAVLEGSVRKAADDLRITAQLIDVDNDEHLWSQDYDRKFENVFSL